jgi:hypothetical protein
MNAVLADARRGHRGLFAFAVGMAALVPVLAVLAVVDDRILLGAPLWLKPLKFAISTGLYTATLSWMLSRLREPALRRSGWVITVALAAEMAIIVGQAALGRRSHYNQDDLVSAVLWQVMAVSIVLLWFATLAVALRFLREPGRDRVATAAVRLGLAVTLLGLLEGFLMANGLAHSVGVPDGGPGLPLAGWSTTGGDLRIAHFVGMHALQGLPLLAAALAAVGRFDEGTRLSLVRIAAGAWAGLVVLLTGQALRAQPLLAPDGLTLAAAAALALGTAAAVAAVLATARRRAVLAVPHA